MKYLTFIGELKPDKRVKNMMITLYKYTLHRLYDTDRRTVVLQFNTLTISVTRQKVRAVPMKSAESSIILRYDDPERGIDGKMNTSAKFVSDEDSFWYQVHFDDIYCVDQVMSLDSDIYTHTWSCMESDCGDPCEGRMCKYVDVTVLNESNVDENENSIEDENKIMRGNCGNGVKVSITKENAIKLGYDFFEVSELAVFGRQLG